MSGLPIELINKFRKTVALSGFLPKVSANSNPLLYVSATEWENAIISGLDLDAMDVRMDIMAVSYCCKDRMTHNLNVHCRPGTLRHEICFESLKRFIRHARVVNNPYRVVPRNIPNRLSSNSEDSSATSETSESEPNETGDAVEVDEEDDHPISASLSAPIHVTCRKPVWSVVFCPEEFEPFANARQRTKA